MESSENLSGKEYSPLLENMEVKNEEQLLEEEIAKKIRDGFIIKVLGIVLYQVVLFFLVVLFGFTIKPFRYLLLTSVLLYRIAYITTIVSLIILVCIPNLFRIVPINYIILSIFVFSYSYELSFFIVRLPPSLVLTTFVLTIALVLILMIYAYRSKNDFTVLGGFLFCALGLMIICLILYFFVKIRFLYMVYIYGGLILYCIFLLYDLQLILGRGERKYRDDDYILAALNIFIDIINLFVRILWILGNYCKFK